MTRIKICGITTAADAAMASDAGADAVGLNFYRKSLRHVSPTLARELVRHLGPFVAPVGLFIPYDPADVQAVAAAVGLRAVQTYRGDGGARQHNLVAAASGLPPTPTNADTPPVVDYTPAADIAAFRVKDAEDLNHIREFVAVCRPAAVLVDSFVAGEMGGTGHPGPWELLAGFDPGVPLILAGGLTPENVADAIRTVRPWGVDVASGVESSPGHKDAAKVRAFVAAVWSA